MSRSHRRVWRGGLFYRIVAPKWTDPADTSFSKERGGRWNPPGEFGALYLNATIQVAAANARAQHAGRALKLFDLLPDARPELVTFEISDRMFLDACTAPGLSALSFAVDFPYGVGWAPCQQVAREAYAHGLPGVTSKSNAEVTPNSCVGEELALFDTVQVGRPKARKKFRRWYPDPIPGE